MIEQLWIAFDRGTSQDPPPCLRTAIRRRKRPLSAAAALALGVAILLVLNGGGLTRPKEIEEEALAPATPLPMALTDADKRGADLFNSIDEPSGETNAWSTARRPALSELLEEVVVKAEAPEAEPFEAEATEAEPFVAEPFVAEATEAELFVAEPFEAEPFEAGAKAAEAEAADAETGAFVQEMATVKTDTTEQMVAAQPGSYSTWKEGPTAAPDDETNASLMSSLSRESARPRLPRPRFRHAVGNHSPESECGVDEPNLQDAPPHAQPQQPRRGVAAFRPSTVLKDAARGAAHAVSTLRDTVWSLLSEEVGRWLRALAFLCGIGRSLRQGKGTSK